jgi:hypothetical protein
MENHFIQKGEEYTYFHPETIDNFYNAISEEVKKNNPPGPCLLGCLAFENVTLRSGEKCKVLLCYNGYKLGPMWDLGIHKALITDDLLCDDSIDLYNELKHAIDA